MLWCGMAGSMSRSNSSELIKIVESNAEQLLPAVKEIIINGDDAHVSDEAVQKLLLASVRLFSSKIDNENRSISAVPEGEMANATEVAVAINELMQAAGLNMFDLAMWTGRRNPSSTAS